MNNAALQRIFWRLHFWAGLLCAPIVLFASLTGLLYVLSPQIEAWRYAALDHVAPAAQPLALDAQVQAALASQPGSTLRQVIPPHAADDSTQVVLNPPRQPHEHHAMADGPDHHGLPDGVLVYVNPATGQVLGSLPELARFRTWAKKLHASALLGDGWRWLMELGASWMLVLMATGTVMWWPRSQARGGPGWRALRPRWDRGRATWRDLHAVVALALGGVLAVVLVTGLTWSRHSGARFSALQQQLGQDSPRPPKALQSAPGNGPMLGWQAAWDRARALAPDVRLQISPPAGDTGTWRVENQDRSQPTARFNLVLDARSGAPLFQSGWDQLPLLSRATAVGIPFHRGEFGLWNQVLLVLTALAAVFSVVSGLAMWWLRRPRGQLAAPTLQRRQLRQAPLWLWPLMAALAWALPVFGWSLLAMLGIEALRLCWPAGAQGHRPDPPAGLH